MNKQEFTVIYIVAIDLEQVKLHFEQGKLSFEQVKGNFKQGHSQYYLLVQNELLLVEMWVSLV